MCVSDVNFLLTRGILWDASVAGEATTASSGMSVLMMVWFDGDVMCVLVWVIVDVLMVCDGVSVVKGM